MTPRAVSVEPDPNGDRSLASARVFPNPGHKQTLFFSLPQESRVVIEIFDVRGRRIDWRDLGVRSAGPLNYVLDAEDRSAGVYMYRLNVIDPETGVVRERVEGKSLLMK